MKKQAFQNHIQRILENHSISLDSDNETIEFEQRGDSEELTAIVFRGGESSLTINEEDGEQLGGMTFSVEDDVDIEYRDIKLLNNSPNVEYLIPENIEVVPNATHGKTLASDSKTLAKENFLAGK